MTPLLWILAAAVVVFFAILLLSLMRTASDADDELDGERWVLNQLEAWEGEWGIYDHDARLDFDRNERIRRQNVRCTRCGCLEANHDEGGCRVCSCSLPAHAIG